MHERFGFTANGYQTWDMEDIVTLGQQTYGCPFFASRTLAKGAEIVFCPYNYVTDPGIREAMDIQLQGSIVICLL